MEEYTEAQAYKHLLTIAQNILNSVQTDSNILEKYNKLKSAVLTKITADTSSQQNNSNKKLLQSYKYITSSFLDVIAQFQTQIENQMSRPAYNKRVIGIVKQWELRIQQLKTVLSDTTTQKQKLIFKEEISALSYYCSEFDRLLIEVHKKMHQIICQASHNQVQKGRKQEELCESLRNMEQQVGEIRSARRFIQQHRITEEKYQQFKVWSNRLTGLLFPH